MISFSRKYNSLIVASLLVVIAASRILFIRHMMMNNDEIWSVWQTLGTPQEIIGWTPYDWPPLYYLTLGLWRGLVGMYPFVLKYLSVLAFMIGCAALYRILHRLKEERAAFIVVPAYAALGYIGVLGTEIRGYALLLGLMPFTFWLMLRYFDHPRWKRGLLLAICLFAMFFISLSSVGVFLILGIYSLIVYPRKIWRWWLPGVVAGIPAIPEVQSKFGIAVVRTGVVSAIVLPPLPQAFVNLFQQFAGNAFILLGIILLTATVLAIYRFQRVNRTTIGLLAWVFGGMLLMYLLNPLIAFFTPRYAWWIMIGIAILIAYGLAQLPRLAAYSAGAILVVLAFMASPIPTVSDFFPALGMDMEWLRDHIETGDVIVLDPHNACAPAEAWDYYMRTYFPNGLQFVTNPDGYQRVWYVTYDQHEDPTLNREVRDQRIADRYIGPPGCLFRLYESPPDLNGIAYENGMRFHGADILDQGDQVWSGPLVRHEGEIIRMRLWWSVDHPVDLDYSIGAYIIRPDHPLTAQVNGPPQITYPVDAPQETSRWQPGQLYVEEVDLAVPYPIGPSKSGIFMAVYFWQDGHRVAALGVGQDGLLLLRPLTIMAW